jgi:uncharacterized membrane protein (DUF485 family)
MSSQIASKIQSNPKYHALVKQRNALGWILSILVCIMYFGFTLMIAYTPDILTAPISSDSVIPVGMLMGVGIIVASAVLTGIYVFRANNTFDPIVSEIIDDAMGHDAAHAPKGGHAYEAA